MEKQENVRHRPAISSGLLGQTSPNETEGLPALTSGQEELHITGYLLSLRFVLQFIMFLCNAFLFYIILRHISCSFNNDAIIMTNPYFKIDSLII